MNTEIKANWIICVAVGVLGALPSTAWPHGFAGQRFFPATLAVEDPFMADEFGFVIGHIKEPGKDGEPANLSTELEAEWAKRITPNFGIFVGGSYRRFDIADEPIIEGFGNLAVGAKYQFLTNAAHEAIMSIGLTAEVGGTGDRDLEADSFSTLSPTLFFGKGMGDLPDSMKYLRPFALTGVVAGNFPTEGETLVRNDEGELENESNPKRVDWGFTFQYNLQYLQSFVRDVGLPAPFNRMIPLVEFNMNTCTSDACDGQTTGFANPGVIWFGKYFQLGIEATVPINGRSGENVGFLAQLHFFIDDIFPNSIGKPLFGEGYSRPAWWTSESR